jgi:hypothetical protein
MDALSSILGWPSEHEAGISAVVGIPVLVGILLTGLRFLLRELNRISSVVPYATGSPHCTEPACRSRRGGGAGEARHVNWEFRKPR